MNDEKNNNVCCDCVHLRKIKMPELQDSYKMRCAITGRFMKEPKRSCKDREQETWERFIENSK
jgi:hypothetical protein